MIIKKLKDGRAALMHMDMSDVLIEIDKETRVQLQKVLCEMYSEILDVCQKHGIIPFLIAGSALGAIRHHGFIPWDDDLDIGMIRTDYEKFLSVFEDEMGGRYILNAPNYSPAPKTRFAKIMKKGTVFKEVSDKDDPELSGIFIDIFVLENVPRNKLVRKLKGMRANALMFISTQVYLTQNNNEYFKKLYSKAGKSNYLTRVAIGKLFSFHKAKWWFDRVDKAARYSKSTGLYGSVKGRRHYFCPYFEEEEMFPPRYVEFAGIKAPVFNEIDAYLRRNYGDYMKLPPVEKRERHFVREIRF